MVDWVAFLEAVKLYDGKAGSGLKFDAAQIAELNKQFGANERFANGGEKDSNLKWVNPLEFLPILILYCRQQNNRIRALEERLQKLEGASDTRLQALEMAVSGLSGDFAASMQNGIQTSARMAGFMDLFKSVMIEEDFTVINSDGTDTVEKVAQQMADFTEKLAESIGVPATTAAVAVAEPTQPVAGGQ